MTCVVPLSTSTHQYSDRSNLANENMGENVETDNWQEKEKDAAGCGVARDGRRGLGDKEDQPGE